MSLSLKPFGKVSGCISIKMLFGDFSSPQVPLEISCAAENMNENLA